jgi:hypothetical protein
MLALNSKDQGDPTNEDRAARARRALEAFFQGDARSDQLGTDVADLLTNLMHLCYLEDVDFQTAVARAERAFEMEVEEEESSACRPSPGGSPKAH